MRKIISWMSEVFGPKAAKFAENPWVASVQETMISAIPVMIISSFVTIISILNEYIENFPDLSEQFYDWLKFLAGSVSAADDCFRETGTA